jgi:hypothetical protein
MREPSKVAPTQGLGIYGLTGYRFDFLGTMPFFGAEYYDSGFPGDLSQAGAVFGGLNVRPTPRVVLKLQYQYAFFPSWKDAPGNAHFNNIDAQAAWSF